MPEGIIATVDNGFATLDFVDQSQRGQALQKLIDIGGPETIETVTRVGPRRQYRVPEGNAREAGLLDEANERQRSAGQDTGYADALAAANPQDGLEDGTVSRPDQITSEGTYVGQTSAADERALAPSPLNIGVDDDSTEGYGGKNAAETNVHRDVIGHVRENTPAPTEVEPEPVVPVSAINLGLANQDAALADDPGARPDAGGPAQAEGDVRVQSTREPGAERRAEAELSNRAKVQTEASAGTAEDNGQGEPNDSWTRAELDSYAAEELGLDTTDLPNKKAVLAAIKEG